MTRDSLYYFLKDHLLAVLATNSLENKPEAAIVGFAISQHLEIIFDTDRSSRKYSNLLQNPYVALVIGWDNETTMQYEGEAVELKGEEADKYKELYFSVFPDGRQRAESPGIVHFKIHPKWIRYSNFNQPQLIREWQF
jgi:pyridoxine/pyridoxamine 5'-phosphate oxidase